MCTKIVAFFEATRKSFCLTFTRVSLSLVIFVSWLKRYLRHAWHHLSYRFLRQFWALQKLTCTVLHEHYTVLTELLWGRVLPKYLKCHMLEITLFFFFSSLGLVPLLIICSNRSTVVEVIVYKMRFDQLNWMYIRIFSCEHLTLSGIVDYLEKRSFAIERRFALKYSIEFLKVAVDRGFEVTTKQKLKYCLRMDVQVLWINLQYIRLKSST